LLLKPENKKFNILPQQFTPDLCSNAEIIDGRRIYTTNTGEHYPSITTILSATMELDKKHILENWQERVGFEEAEKIKNDAADRGTDLHNLMEKYIFGQDYSEDLKNSTPLVRKMFGQFIPVLNRVDNVRLMEKPLYSSGLKIAGRVDMVAEVDGILSVIDFKTSTRVKTKDMIGDYLLQECFYSICYAEHFHEKIQQCVTIIGTEKSLKAYVFIDSPKKSLTNLIKRVQLFYETN
jgi:hypothetical protein